MTTEQFLICKADFLATYKDILCNESTEDIQASQTPVQFIRLLHKFATFLRYKAIPSAEWARQWFKDETQLLNECGVFLDQILSLKDPDERSLILLGTSNLHITYTLPRLCNLTLQDDSTASLLLFNTAHCTVREKGTQHAEIITCNKPATVKIHRL